MLMKSVVIFCCVAVVLSATEKDKYSDRYDNIDIVEILGNKRLLGGYMNCMLDKGKCTAQGNAFRNHLGDALETGCVKCTETQKDKSSKVIEHLIAYEIGYWKELCAKYDPNGVFRNKYEKEAMAKGIIIPKN